MKIEVGKTYVTRDGMREVMVMDKPWNWYLCRITKGKAFSTGSDYHVRSTGRARVKDDISPLDLVAEVQP